MTRHTEREDAMLLAAIGSALGLDGPYAEHGVRDPDAEHPRPTRRVHAGAVHPDGRVAWVEERRAPPVGAHVACHLELHVAGGGEHAAVDLPTYNAYFGCDVAFVRWIGDAVTLLYREKHAWLLARWRPSQGFELVEVDGGFFAGDGVWCLDEPAVLRGWDVGTLAPLPAVPLPPRPPHTWRRLARAEPGVALLEWESRGGEGPEDGAVHPLRIPLPPPGLTLPDLVAPARALVRAAGVPRDRLGSTVETLLRPWRVAPVAPVAPVPSYAALPERVPLPKPRALAPEVRAALQKVVPAEPAWGWTGNVTRMLEARVVGVLGGG